MAVKIINAIKSLKSERYNKKNILYCGMFILCLTIITNLLDIHKNDLIAQFIIFSLLLLFQSVIECGYGTIATNKEINKENSVFPSLNNIKEILLVGLKTTSGVLIIWLISGLIIGLTSGLLSLLTTIGMIKEVAPEALTGIFFIIFIILFVLLAIIFDYYFITPIILNFYKELKFKDFFNLKDARNFRQERGNHYTSYFVIYFLLLILTIIIACVSGYYAEKATNNTKDIATISIAITTSFIMSISWILILPNLVAQVYDKTKATTEDEDFMNDDDFEEAIKEEEMKEYQEEKIFDNEDFE